MLRVFSTQHALKRYRTVLFILLTEVCLLCKVRDSYFVFPFRARRLISERSHVPARKADNEDFLLVQSVTRPLYERRMSLPGDIET